MNQYYRNPPTKFPSINKRPEIDIKGNDRVTFGRIPQNPARIQQLDNPFKPENSGHNQKAISNIFMFNDRQRMRLTESHASDDSEAQFDKMKTRQNSANIHRINHHCSVAFNDSQHSNPKEDRIDITKQQQINYAQKTKQKHQKYEQYVIKNEQDYQQPLIVEQQQKTHVSSFIKLTGKQMLESIIDNPSRNNRKQKEILNINIDPIDDNISEIKAALRIQQQLPNNTYQQIEEPIDEDLPSVITEFVNQKEPSMFQISKVALPLACSINKSNQSEVSFIDKIRGQSQIIQSRAIGDIQCNTNRQQYKQINGQQRRKKRVKIFDRKLENKAKTKKDLSNSRSPQRSNRSPIFSRRSPQKYSGIKHYNDHLPTNAGSPSRESNLRVESRITADQGNKTCPHTLCILKSLQIIDKLTDVKIDGSRSKQQKTQVSRIKKFQQICSCVFQISLKLDNFLTKTELKALMNSQVKLQIGRISDEVQKLMRVIRDEEYFMNFAQINRAEQADPLNNLKSMYQQTNCLKLIQGRYQKWQHKLPALGQQISDIFKYQYNEQVGILTKIRHTISQLRDSYVFCQNSPSFSLSLYRLYNQYVQKQANQLQQTLLWIKTQIFNGNQA